MYSLISTYPIGWQLRFRVLPRLDLRPTLLPCMMRNIKSGAGWGAYLPQGRLMRTLHACQASRVLELRFTCLSQAPLFRSISEKCAVEIEYRLFNSRNCDSDTLVPALAHPPSAHIHICIVCVRTCWPVSSRAVGQQQTRVI